MKKYIIILLVISLILPQAMVFGESDTHYYIQAGAYSSSDNAQYQLDKLQEYGYTTSLKLENGLYIVLLGPYETYGLAEEKLAILIGFNESGFIISKKKDSATLVVSEKESVVVEQVEVSEPVEVAVREDVSVKNFRLANDARLDGFYGQYSLFFQVSNEWDVLETSFVELLIKRSSISEFDNNSITILLNGTPLESVWINQEIGNELLIRVGLPVHLINKGFNTLEARSYHRLTDKPCEDELNPANWVLIDKSSFLHLEYVARVDKVGIKNFPYPYVEPLLDLPVRANVYAPNKAKAHEAELLLGLYGYFGQSNPFANVNINVDAYNDNDSGDYIVLGSLESIPSHLLEGYSIDKTRLESEGLIIERVNPLDEDKRILLLISENSEASKAIINVLSNPDVLNQVDTTSLWVSKDLFPSATMEEFSDYISFESLGYNSINLSGARFASGTYTFNKPKHWTINEGAKLLVNFRYSDIVDYDLSSLTVYLNNVPIGSKQFKSENRMADQLVIPIPNNLLNESSYFIRFDVSLNLEGNDCDGSSLNNNLWALISNSSFMHLPHDIKDSYALEDFTAPFVKNNALNNVTFIMQEDMSVNQLRIASSILTYLGHSLETLEGLKVVTDDEGVLGNKIYIGIADKHVGIQKLNDKLLLKFDKNFKQLESNENLVLLPSYARSSSVIQLIEDEESTTLLISGTNEDSMSVASLYLSDFEFVPRLSGNVAVIGSNGSIQSAYVGIDKPVSVDEEALLEADQEQVIEKLSTDEITTFIYFILIVFFVMLIIAFIVGRRKKNNE